MLWFLLDSISPINPWFTGLWFALLFTGGGWITRHPLIGAGRVMVDFFQFIPYCMCQMQVHANFWVPELKNTGFRAVLLFWQNHMSKILRFWIERIKTALNFLKMHQICWERSYFKAWICGNIINEHFAQKKIGFWLFQGNITKKSSFSVF